MRKFYFAVSNHRPDGLATIWVYAKRNFSYAEAYSKMTMLAAALVSKCQTLFVVLNDGFKCSMESKNAVVIGRFRLQVEIVVPKETVSIVLTFLKSNWKGKWIQEEAWNSNETFKS